MHFSRLKNIAGDTRVVLLLLVKSFTTSFTYKWLAFVSSHLFVFSVCSRNPSPPLEDSRSGVDLGSIMSSSVKSGFAVAKPQKVLTSPFAQTFQQIAPTWPPFNPQSQKYMALG